MIAPVTPISTIRPSRSFAHRDPDNDDFIGEDIGYPNRRAQYRGYRVLVGLILVAGIVALVGGVLQGAGTIGAAFPSLQSLTQVAAWAQFFSGLGQMATVGLFVVIAALLLRWRIRRHRRRT